MPNYQDASLATYIPLSSSSVINTLLIGTKWGGGLGYPGSLSYSFHIPGVSRYATNYSDDNEHLNAYALSEAQQEAIRVALSSWSAVANLTFTEVTDTAAGLVGDLRFGGYQYMSEESAAWAYVPFSAPVAGDVWVGPVTNEPQPSPGSYDYLTFVHEIGHALGLKHPFEESGSNKFVLTGRFDDVRYTVMSYNDSYDFQPTGPMLFDIAAMQYIYGSNDSWRTGDDVYRWSPDARVFETIWDAGGNDTIDASNQLTGVAIDLNSGEFSSLGQNIYNWKTGVSSNNFLTIAYGTVIENALGSDYNDTLIGNDANNLLEGGKGRDTLRGGLGNDTYVIEIPNSGFYDTVIERAGQGYDRVILRGDSAGFFGSRYALDVNVEELDASQTSNVQLELYGNAQSNKIIGNAENNVLNGGAGADTLIGGAGNDSYVVDSADDVVIEQANEGTDQVQVAIATAGGTYVLSEHLENATLINSAAFNLTGNAGDNVLIGNAANNRIDGGLGADVMNGGAGDDTYFVDNDGDVITDSSGIDAVNSTISYSLGANLEHLTLLGSDDLSATGNALANTLTGNDGNNRLDGGAGVDTLRGGKGDDTYSVDLTSRNALEDKLLENANEGTDTLQLRGGTAALTSATTIALGNHLENLDVSATGLVRLNLTGNALNNVLTGNAADNVLNGGAGADTLIGGAGNDSYVVDSADDVVIEQANEGTDLVQVAMASAGGTYVLGEHLENATLINGVAFNLTGNAGNNVLTGNKANNLIDGGLGADVMNGGAGNDTYIVDDSGDVIQDSAGIDAVRASISYTLGLGLENLVLTGNQAISATGNALANVLDGSQNSAANELRGLAGNDTYIVGAGDSVIEEAKGGIDTVQSYVDFTLGDNLEHLTLLGSDDLSATGNALANTLTGNDGNNRLDGGAGVDTLRGGKGDDTYIVDLTTRNALEDKLLENANEGTDTLQLRGGNAALTSATAIALGNHLENLDASDTGLVRLNLTGNALNNVLTGNAADNVLNGGAGADTLIGGAGSDTYVVDNAGDVLVEQDNEGIDLVRVAIATAGGTYVLGEHLENATLINGVAFNLTGNAGDNVLTGNKANNLIDGGLGADVMNGGAGNDTYIVDDSGDVIQDSAGIDAVRASISYTLGLGLENLVLTGNQAISATGNALANVLDGSQNSAANELRGLAGNDTYIVGAGDSVIEEAKGGIDTVQSYVDFTLSDNLEHLTLLGSDDLSATGNALANTLTGNDGNNRLDGGAGVDTLRGGKGDDTYIVDLTSRNALEDKLLENANEGTDTLQLRGGNAALTSATTVTLGNHLENLDASDTGLVRLNLTGNALNNVLTGNAADNVLNGGAGADTLIGGGGIDKLTGGTGADTFRFDLAWFNAISSGIDSLITDFKHAEGDKIQFIGEGAQGFSFAGQTYNQENPQTHQLRFEEGTLYGSVDSGASNLFEIRLLGVTALTQSDFLFG